MKTMELGTKQTHIAEMREISVNRAAEVCRLLGISMQQYCQHQYDQYELFIRHICKQMPYLCREMRYSPVFRGFWNNEWAARNDREFLVFAYDCKFNKAEMAEEYMFINNYLQLANDDEFMARYDHILKQIK